MAGFCSYLYFSALVDICSDVYDVREEICKGVVVVGGGVVTVTFTPTLLKALGFISAEIAAEYIAAKIMVTLGVVKAGRLFAFLQSQGAPDLWTAGTIIVGTFGGWLGWMLSSICDQT